MTKPSGLPADRESAVMPAKLAPKKVWRHFYSPAEAWERVTGADVAALRQAAERAAGIGRSEFEELPLIPPRPWARFRELADVDHDSHYGPAYAAVVASVTTEWGQHVSRPGRWLGRAENGILVFLQDAAPSWIVTAFRPVPMACDVNPDEETIQLQAHFEFWKWTMPRDIARSAFRDWLQGHANQVPKTTDELWRLALVLGYSRAEASPSPDVVAADASLRATDPDLRAALRRALDWGGALDALRHGVSGADAVELELALMGADGLLTVAEVLGEHQAGEEFLADSEAVLGWTPVEWSHLIEFAQAQTHGVDPGLSGRIWMTTRDALMGAIIRESRPASRPVPSLVDTLLKARATDLSWRARLASQLQKARTGLETGATSFIDALCLVPQPAHLGAGEEAWDVVAPAPARGSHLRAFVADETENKFGREVSEYITGDESSLWSLDKPGEVLTVIVFEAPLPIAGDSLDDVIEESQARADVSVSVRTFTRPS